MKSCLLLLVAKFCETNNSIQLFVIENMRLDTNFTQIIQVLQKIKHFAFLPLEGVLCNYSI